LDHFSYKNGEMCAEDVALSDIAGDIGTPFYCYSTATLQRHFRVFQNAFKGRDVVICYAVKANSNQAVLKTLANEGAGADVVSGGELKRALLAGIPGERIVFSGVGKTPGEIRAGLDAGIMQFSVESEPELELISKLAVEKGMTAPVSVRINPDVDAKTHAKISTGKAENKFGVNWTRARDVYRRISQLEGVEAVGVNMHIGSQLTSIEPFRAAFTRLRDLVKDLRSDGHAIRNVDLGGGLGIPYNPGETAPPLPDEYGALVGELIGGLDCRLVFEPGRMIAGNAGIIVSEVLYVKEGDARRFVIVDAAMNDLSRPAMYGAYHDIVPVSEPESAERDWVADYVGPVCETGDTFAEQRLGHQVKAGDLIAFKSAGAYGAVMSNSYNSRALVPEVMVSGASYAVVRPREDVDALIAKDRLPDWL